MKRANGTGSIVKKKGRSNPYLVYAPAKFENGKRVVPYLGAFRLKSEAQNFLDEYNHDPTVYRNKMTFSQVYEDFKKSKRYEKISKSQKDCYSAAYKQCSELANIQFSEIRTVQLQSIIDRMEKDGKSLSSVKKVKSLFSSLYSYAIQNDIAKKDYAHFVVMPNIETKEKRAFTDEEIEKIKTAAASGNKAAEWVLYLIYSGWRISEMLELTSASYNESEKAFCGGKKTKNGKNRIVPVHPSVQHIVEKQLSEKGDTVFCLESGKAMTANYFRRYVFSPLLSELQIDESLTPHNTRHTFATLLKRNGADEFYRKRLLGHASGDITNDVYTHEDIDGLRTAIMCLEKPSATSLENTSKKLLKLLKNIAV